MMNRESCCQEEKDKDTRGTLSWMTARESCCQEEKDKEEPSWEAAVVGNLGAAQVCHAPAGGPAQLLLLLPPVSGVWGWAGHLLAIPVMPASP